MPRRDKLHSSYVYEASGFGELAGLCSVRLIQKEECTLHEMIAGVRAGQKPRRQLIKKLTAKGSIAAGVEATVAASFTPSASTAAIQVKPAIPT